MRIGRGLSRIVRMPQAQHTAPALIWNHTGMGMGPIIEDANFESRAHFQVLGVCGAEHIHVDGRNCGVVTLLTNELGCGLWSYHMEA